MSGKDFPASHVPLESAQLDAFPSDHHHKQTQPQDSHVHSHCTAQDAEAPHAQAAFPGPAQNLPDLSQQTAVIDHLPIAEGQVSTPPASQRGTHPSFRHVAQSPLPVMQQPAVSMVPPDQPIMTHQQPALGLEQSPREVEQGSVPDHYSPMFSLDPYTYPISSTETGPLVQPSRPSSDGSFVFASDLARDDAMGGAASAPFVKFTTAAVPNEARLVNIASLGFGALVATGRDSSLPSDPPLVRHPPVRCQTCGAYSNLFCPLVPHSGEWKCVFCGKPNFSEGEYAIGRGENFAEWPELTSRVVDYVDSGSRLFPTAADTTLSAPIVFLVDESLEDRELQQLQAALLDTLSKLDPSTRIGIISYGASVSVYDLSQSSAACAETFPGKASVSSSTAKDLLYNSAVFLSPLHSCLLAAQTIVSSFKPYSGALPEGSRSRCLGAALEVALVLVRGPATDMPRSPIRRTGGSSRLVVCAGGPLTCGPGSVPNSERHPNFLYEMKKARKFMEQVGKEAHALETAVDIFWAGVFPPRAKLLLPVTELSGGVLVLLDDFGNTFRPNLLRACSRVQGSRGWLEVRTSREVHVTRVIGPAELAGWGAASESIFPKDKATRLELNSVEEGQGLAICMELKEDTAKDFLYFQFANRFLDVHQNDITRVVTIRLPTCGSLASYLASIDSEAATVMISKRTIVGAIAAESVQESRAWVDARAKDLALKLGHVPPKSRMRKFPSELSSIAEALYHLKRGPLLGHVTASEDERSILHSLFLRSMHAHSLRFVVPRLLMLKKYADFVEVPPADLSLMSDVALLLDNGVDIFVWIGSELASDPSWKLWAEERCQNLALEIAQQRFPIPRIRMFAEDDPLARFMTSRLLPAHKDPITQQELRFPPLGELLPDQRAKLKAKFLPIDEPSFLEWMTSLNISPPDHPASLRKVAL